MFTTTQEESDFLQSCLLIFWAPLFLPHTLSWCLFALLWCTVDLHCCWFSGDTEMYDGRLSSSWVVSVLTAHPVMYPRWVFLVRAVPNWLSEHPVLASPSSRVLFLSLILSCPPHSSVCGKNFRGYRFLKSCCHWCWDLSCNPRDKT